MRSDSTLVRSRRAAREAAFKSVFAMTFGGMVLDEALESEVTGDEFTSEVLAWIRTVVGGVMGDPAGWDEKYVPFLTASWPIDRLAMTDKTVLRMACYEFWKLPETPPKVTISEYVDIAKKYGSAESGKFVNGVLASVLKVSPKAEWQRPAESTELVKIEEATVPSEPVKPKRKPSAKWVIKSEG